MTTECRIEGCHRPRLRHRTICQTHVSRLRRHQDPDFLQWSTADDYDVDLIVRERRPAEGLTRLERVMVARGLTERDVPAREVARIVGVTTRSVERWRSEGFRQARAAC